MKTTSEMYKEEIKNQVCIDPKKVHKNGRMPDIATWQKREAIVLNVPPKTKGENPMERLDVEYEVE